MRDKTGFLEREASAVPEVSSEKGAKFAHCLSPMTDPVFFFLAQLSKRFSQRGTKE